MIYDYDACMIFMGYEIPICICLVVCCYYLDNKFLFLRDSSWNFPTYKWSILYATVEEQLT